MERRVIVGASLLTAASLWVLWKRTCPGSLLCSTKPSDNALKQLEKDLSVPVDLLHEIARHMVSEMEKGLESDGQTLKMIPSFVTSLPKGTEMGTFLALDLGGSNFRVCDVTLDGQGGTKVRSNKYTVTEELKKGSGIALFDFFAECVKSFVEQLAIESNSTTKMGFTFSFPVYQLTLDKGTLIEWTKGFNASGVEGKDVVGLLQDALKRKGVNIKVTALVNDTVGTLVAHAYKDPNTVVGVILGTGTNAAYFEKIENMKKWKGPIPESKKMIINSEWGAFDEEHAILPITKYDLELDKHSQHAGKQTFEKLISGRYLGEIVRLILVDFTKQGLLFNDQPISILSKKNSFETAFLSKVELDISNDLKDIREFMAQEFNIQTTLKERQWIKKVTVLVGTRAARLTAAGIAAMVMKTQSWNGCTIAIDGSVFEHYPYFAARVKIALKETLGVIAENVKLSQARDGSGQGAGIIAALARK